MNTGYQSKLSDIIYLFDVASESDRHRVASLVNATVIDQDGTLAFFDVSGREITIAEIHRRTQTDSTIQQSVYNMWMTYAH